MYNISPRVVESQGALTYELTYFVPYTAIPASKVKPLEGSEMKNPILVSTNEEKLEPSKALFLPVQGSAAVKGVKVLLILKGILTAATILESILDALNRIINCHEKRIQFEAA